GGAFSFTHQYLDDNPTATPSDVYTIGATLTDDDTDTDTDSATSTVSNVAPAAAILGAPATSPEGTPITVTAAVTDPGTLDVFSYAWTVTKNGAPYASLSGTGAGFASFTFTPNDNGAIPYVVSLVVTDDDSGASSPASASIVVIDVEPTIALSGASSIDEGSIYTLTLGAITDPGTDTVTQWLVFWGDSTSNTYTSGGPKTHLYDDNALVTDIIRVTLVDEDGGHANAGTLSRTVNNVAPTAIPLNGGAVNEGSNGLALFVGQGDVSSADAGAGYLYAYDFDNNGTFEIVDSALDSVTVPGTYLNDDPSKTVRMAIRDKDGDFGVPGSYREYFSTIAVNNVAPVVSAIANATAFSGELFTQTVNFTDPGLVDLHTVTIDWKDGPLETYPLSVGTRSFTISHTYTPGTTPHTYSGVTVTVDDGDGGANSKSFDVTVNQNTFRVASFTTNPSGFDVQFNRPANLLKLNLYDGIDVSADLPDITVVGGTVGAVRGSMVWNAAANTMTFVKTGGVLAADTYTVTLVSGADAWQDVSGSLLDGNGDFSPGGNYVSSFIVSSSTARVVSMPDFTRGAGQNVNLPATASNGIPIRIDNAAGVKSVDLWIEYDPTLLTINSATLASGMPFDWVLTSNLTTPGLMKLGLSGTTILSGLNLNLIKLNAVVPDAAPYGNSEVLEITYLNVNEGGIQAKGDNAVHKALYIGDVDGDGIYSPLDPARISGVVVDLNSGFDIADWTDPVIVGDTTGNGQLTSLDATYVAQKIVLIPTPEIPNIPVLPGGRVDRTVGVDPQISIPLAITAARGSVASVPVNIDIEAGVNVVGASFAVAYDTAKLQFSGVERTAYWPASEWAVLANPDTTPGTVYVVFYNTQGNGSTAPGGTMANLQFAVNPAADLGTTALDVQRLVEDTGGLVWTFVDGSIQIGIRTVTWDGGGTDDNWTTGANWVGDAKPMPGDNLVFPAGAARMDNVNDFVSCETFGSIVVSGGNYHIQNNPLRSASVEVQGTSELTAVSIISESLIIGPPSSGASAADSAGAAAQLPGEAPESPASGYTASTTEESAAMVADAADGGFLAELPSVSKASLAIAPPAFAVSAPFAAEIPWLAPAAFNRLASLSEIVPAARLLESTLVGTPFARSSDAELSSFDNRRELAFAERLLNSATERLDDSAYEEMADSLAKAATQSSLAASEGENARGRALDSIVAEFRHDLAIDSELLLGRHSRNREKLAKKAVNDLHSRLVARD
ncbi:MAG: hypothetical protein IT426_07130, partial [Pirellulales bacterium]|nr:hypothetical protein [Pirellulales bacterium]